MRSSALRVLMAMTLAVPCVAQVEPVEPRQVALGGPRFLRSAAPDAEVVDPARVPELQRRVSLTPREATLGAALRAITAQTGVRFLLSRDVVPVTTPVRVEATGLSVAAVLTELLLHADVDVAVVSPRELALVRRHLAMVQDSGAVAGRVTDAKTGGVLVGATVALGDMSKNATTGGDGRYRIAGVPVGIYTLRARYIGYAPGTVSVTVTTDQEATADFTLDKSAQRLDEVVTTGTVVPTEVKALPSPISIVGGEQIREQNLTRIDQIFRGAVPGAVAWDVGAIDNFSGMPSIRGVTGLAISSPMKTYVDDVEIADPSEYLAAADAANIERVEIIRGPEASTVYGSDASGGVMRIFTNKGTTSGRSEVSGQALLGVMQGPYASSAPLRQDYRLNLMGGTPGFSYNLGGSYLGTGNVTPDYWSRTPNLFGGASLTQGPFAVEFSAAYVDRRLALPAPPQFPSTWLAFSKPNYSEAQIAEQTYGLSVSYRATNHWQHSLSLGFNGETSGNWQTQPRFTTPADSFLFAINSTTSKASVRYNTSYDLPLGSEVGMTAIAGAEYYAYAYESRLTINPTRITGSLDGTTFLTSTPYSNAGFFGQLQANVLRRLFLTGGIRAERNDNFGSNYGTAWQPRLGASYVQPLGDLSLKLRGSWGNALRGVDPGEKEAQKTPYSVQLANPALAPERQSGWDAGLDLQIGNRATVGITYYDQNATDLIDNVLIPGAAALPVYQWQNTGRIKNRGWELEGHLDLGRFDLGATFSPTTSTVLALSPTYTGDLVIGDRPLGVPVNSGGATLGWKPLDGTSVLLSATYIGHWTNYDTVALYGDFFGGEPYRGSLRAYWTDYPSVTKFGLSASQRVTRQVSALLQVDNLGNNQRYERTNGTVPVGRITSVGFQFHH